jgi:2-hydroxymuconate-semialdehyde hydrolase
VRATLEQFVVDTSLVTDELVALRYRAALNDTASDTLAQVVAARDRDRTQLPLDRGRLAGLEIPVLLVHGVQGVVIPMSRTWELLNEIPHHRAIHDLGARRQIQRGDRRLLGGRRMNRWALPKMSSES